MVAKGGPIQESVETNDQNMMTLVSVELAFNWGYIKNGLRIVLTGEELSPHGIDDDGRDSFGNHFACYPLTGTTGITVYAHL